MTTTSPRTFDRRRRLAAAVMALPLSLAMTGSAFATGSTLEPPTSGSSAAESRTAALTAPAAAGGSPSEKAAAAAAAAEKGAAEKAVAAERAASAQAAAAAKAAERSAPGAAAGSAAGTGAAAAGTGGTFVNGNTNSSKAERPSAPVPGAPSQPLSTADRNGTGANPGETCTHNYCSNGTGLPTGNGVGDGKAVGQPCAGCVGKADNKNPKGQAPSGPVDRNAGYECDRNQGVGQTNPAHTGCTSSAASPAATQPAKKPAPPSTPPKTAQNPGEGTAVMTIAVDCRTVTVTSSKDISHMAVFFVDGTSIKIDGLSGKTVTRTFDKDILRATSKSATSTVGAPATGCALLPTSGSTPPVQTCPDGSSMPAGGCPVAGTTPAGPATGGTVELCPNGEVMRGGNPANCPTAPPVCPTAMPVAGPVQAGCAPTAPPTQGGGETSTPPIGGLPIGEVTPGQPAINPPGQTPPGQTPPGQTPARGGLPIGTVTPGQPAANPVPAGPSTGITPRAAAPQLVVGLPTTPARARAVPSALPFTGTDAALLAELGVLLLLAGAGIAVAARRERTARAA